MTGLAMTGLAEPRARRAPRLFVEQSLDAGVPVTLAPAQVNYLVNVLRLKAGATVLAFNGRDGEWRCRIEYVGRKTVQLVPEAVVRPQAWGGDLHLIFAPLKHARLDYAVQKATEMGVSRLVPVITRHTAATRLNLDRMRANAIEAAEQCGLLAIPEVVVPEPLPAALERLEPQRTLVFCDEAAPSEQTVSEPVGGAGGPLAALSAIEPHTPLALLIGPEGGFADEERALIRARPGLVRLALGPRILRADTAAVAALALVQATAGDWVRLRPSSS
jgi:16S rRNA (uracil1498-N3)-methyltransferase